MKKHKLLLLIILLLTLPIFASSAFCQNFDSNSNGTRTIYLIRHGQYDHSDTTDADVGKGLVPIGIAQTRLLSARLKAMPVKFTSLTSSTMTRAKQTAIIINEDFSNLELKQRKIIRECTPPTWREDVMADETESELNDCVENLEQAFQEFFIPSPDEKDRYDLIVCHGNVIRYFVTKILKVDSMAWLQMSITNCSLTIIRIKPDGTMKLDTFSDHGHIPENMRTFTGGDDETKELVVP